MRGVFLARTAASLAAAWLPPLLLGLWVGWQAARLHAPAWNDPDHDHNPDPTPWRPPQKAADSAGLHPTAPPRNNRSTSSRTAALPVTDVVGFLEAQQRGLPLPAPLNVLLLTSAIAGPTPSGGIGAAFLHLARHLAEAQQARTGKPRFNVTVLYAAHPWYGVGTAAQWVRHFATLGITFVPLPGDDARFYGPKLAKRAYRALQWLRPREAEFHLLTTHDHMGLGYYIALAKRQGLAFRHLPLLLQCHSTTRWADELNRRPPRDHNTLATYFAEQKTLEWADYRVSPSHDYLHWLATAKPTHDLAQGLSFVLPNTMHPLPAGRPWLEAIQPIHSRHVAFFGRLEVRKGLLVFFQALRLLLPRLAEQQPPPQQDEMGTFTLAVSFLGPDVAVQGEKASQAILKLQRELEPTYRVRFHMLTSMPTQPALTYLRERNAIVVMPSLGDNSPYALLEVMAAGLPCIITSAGGGLELVHRDGGTDHQIVEPNSPEALCDSLFHVLQSGATLFRPSRSFETVRDHYLGLLEATAVHAVATLPPAPTLPPLPRVMVGVTSFNRPDTLPSTVASLLGQAYPHTLLGLVVVDDASQLPAMVATLAALQARLQASDLREATLVRNTEHQFVAATRNQLFDMALRRGYDWVCLMDDDDLAKPHMVARYMQVAQQLPETDLLMDVSENYDVDAQQRRTLSHTSLALGNAFSHNFFINNYGKANFCVRPEAAMRIGGHQVGEFSQSPFVDWGFLTRASLAGLAMELVPEPLYEYSKLTQGSISRQMTDPGLFYEGHAKMLHDVQASAPEHLHDVLLLCRYALALPTVQADGPR